MPQVTLGFKLKEGERGELWLNTETGELGVGGLSLLAEEWQSLNKRVEACFRRTGIIKTPKAAATPIATRFILSNLPALNKVTRGKVKKAPFPLCLLYDSVITKEKMEPAEIGL